MIYITGDTHGQFKKIKTFCEEFQTTTDDIIIILGDAGINYHGGSKDLNVKYYLKKLPITLFCIHGNHEMRPHCINSYEIINFMGGKVFQDKAFPNILFAIDGEVYNFNGLKTMVCGGAYSVDKDYRIARGLPWFANEQPHIKTKTKVENILKELDYNVDIFLSHTCPFNYMPTEVFLPYVDQSTVDKSTEEWLQTIEDKIKYKAWYCGHYHINKDIDKIHFLFDDIKELL